MNALLIAPQRLVQTPDGQHWAPTRAGSYSFWRRFLDVYDRASLLTRVRRCPSPPAGWLPATGQGIDGIGVPDFHTPRELVRVMRPIIRTLDEELSRPRAIHMRVPDLLSYIAAYRMPRHRPYAVDVVGDPYDSFAPGAFDSPFSRLYRRIIPWQLRRLCARASGSAYVTESALQERYPPAAGSFTTHYSSIELEAGEIVGSPRRFDAPLDRPRLLFVGTLAQLYKAPDVLIDATARAAASGLDLHLTIAGDGACRPELESRVQQLGISDRVRFAGRLNGWSAVRKELDAADLFVLPSRQEGLPRVVIEASARALPCIASTIGGTGEILASEDLVSPDDVDGLTAKICDVLRDPARMSRMSERNRERSLDYRSEILLDRRRALYEHMVGSTEAWFAS